MPDFPKIVLFFILCLTGFIALFFYLTDNNATQGESIRFSTWGSESEMSLLKPLLKEFERKNPHIKVELIHIPQNYFQKLHLMVAANLTPDVMFINNISAGSYAANNILEDLHGYMIDNENTLDQYQSSNNSLSPDDFFSQSLKALSYKNKLYAIPRDVSSMVTYVNKDILKQSGIALKEKSWSYEEFITYCKIIRKKNKDIFAVSAEQVFLYWLPSVMSSGGNLVDEEGHYILNKSCHVIQEYADFANKLKIAPKPKDIGSATLSQLFINGKLAMYISGRWSVPRFKKDIKFNWTIMPVPSGQDGSITSVDASGWAMAKNSSHKKEAWQLIKFLASDRSMKEFSQSGLITPAKKSIAQSPEFINILPKEDSEIFLKVIDTGKPTPTLTHWNRFIDIINEALVPVWENKVNACDALDRVRGKVDKILQYK